MRSLAPFRRKLVELRQVISGLLRLFRLGIHGDEKFKCLARFVGVFQILLVNLAYRVKRIASEVVFRILVGENPVGSDRVQKVRVRGKHIPHLAVKFRNRGKRQRDLA